MGEDLFYDLDLIMLNLNHLQILRGENIHMLYLYYLRMNGIVLNMFRYIMVFILISFRSQSNRNRHSLVII